MLLLEKAFVKSLWKAWCAVPLASMSPNTDLLVACLFAGGGLLLSWFWPWDVDKDLGV